MEAAPKLQMMSFDFIAPPDKEKRYPDIAGAVERFILARHQDDPGNYTDELRQLRDLQRQAYQVPRTAQGLETLKRYLGQLKMLQARFPLGSSSTDAACADLQFTWYDAFSGEKILATDVRLEEACIMHNIAALHSYLGADSARATAEQMKQSCSHFQYAAWAFEQVKSMYSPIESPDSPSIPSLSKGYLNYARLLMLAQAQECILEKSLLDSRKSMTIAKVAAQVVQYYRDAEQISADQCGTLRASPAAAALFADLVSLNDCIPTKYLQFKQFYYNVITYYACGCHADDAQKMGERVAYFAEAQHQLDTATKTLHKTDEAVRCADALQFVGDVVGTKLQAAKKDNDFIYHEKVPKIATLPPVACANLVKPVAFDIPSPDAVDIFHALVPMPVYEQLSVYSEKKAEKLRAILAQVEFKNDSLAEFMSSVDIDTLKSYCRKANSDEKSNQNQNLPQDLLDACADISSASKNAEQMKVRVGELSQISMQLRQKLAELRKLIAERGVRAENELTTMPQVANSKRPVLKFNELLQTVDQYERAHAQAKTSDSEVEKLLIDQQNLVDWKLMSGHVDDVARNVPKFSIMDAPNVEEQLTQLDVLIGKVHEMKRQRDEFVEQLRKSMDSDDIRQAIMLAMSPGAEPPNFDAVFERELKKFQPQIDLLEQNMRAQQTIIDAIIDANAKCAELRQYVVGTMGARDKRIRKFLDSAALFAEVTKKVDAGSKFYDDFRKRVDKLDEQVREKLQQFEAYKVAVQQQQQQAAAAAEQIRNRQSNAAAAAASVVPSFRPQQQPLMPNVSTTSGMSANAFPPVSGGGGGLTLGDYMKQMKLASNTGDGGQKFVATANLQQNNIPRNDFRSYNDPSAYAANDAAAENAALKAAHDALRALPSPSLRSGGGGVQNPNQLPALQQQTSVNNYPYQAQQIRRPVPPSQFTAQQPLSNFSAVSAAAQPLMHPSMQNAPSASSFISQPLQPQHFMTTTPTTSHINTSFYNSPQFGNSAVGSGPASYAAQSHFNSTSTTPNMKIANLHYQPSATPLLPASSSSSAGTLPYSPIMPIQPISSLLHHNVRPAVTNVPYMPNFGGMPPQQPSTSNHSNTGVNFSTVSATNAAANGLAWQPTNISSGQFSTQQMPTLLMPATTPSHAPMSAVSNSVQQVPSAFSSSSRYSAMLPLVTSNFDHRTVHNTNPNAIPSPSMPTVQSQSTFLVADLNHHQQQRLSAYSSLLNDNSKLNHSVSNPSAAAGGEGSLVSSYAQLLNGGGAKPTQQNVQPSANMNQQYGSISAAYDTTTANGVNTQQQYGNGASQLAHADMHPHANGHSVLYASEQHSTIGNANGIAQHYSAPLQPPTVSEPKSIANAKHSFSSDLDQLMGWSGGLDDAKVVARQQQPFTGFVVDSLAMPHAAPDPNSLI